MKSKKLKILSCSLLFCISLAFPSVAEVWTPPILTAEESQNVVGWSLTDAFYTEGQNASRISVEVETPNEAKNSYGKRIICASFSEGACSEIKNRQSNAVLLLPRCTSKKDEWCIESLSFSNAKSKAQSAEFVRQVDGVETSERTDLGYPKGSTVSLWRASKYINAGDSDMYAAYVMVRMFRFPDKGTSVAYLSAAVIPYREIKDLESSRKVSYQKTSLTPQTTSDGSTEYLISGGSPECAWTENGKCGLIEDFAPGTSTSITLRVSKRITGWISGRMTSPVVSLTAFNSNQNRVTVSGVAAVIPRFYAATSQENLTEKLKSTWNPASGGIANPRGVYLQKSSGPGVFDVLRTWQEVAGDKAAGLSSSWQFDTIANGTPYINNDYSCRDSNGSLQGIVTTNAMAYSGTAPRFERGSLNYELAGMHLNPDGLVFRGTYELVLSKATAQCLYKISNRPLVAEVSVVDEGESAQVKTFSISQHGKGKNSWIRISVKGITFSNPTVKVKLRSK